MRLRIFSVLFLAAAAMTFSLIRGQERPPAAGAATTTVGGSAAPPAPLTPAVHRDFSKFGVFEKEMLVSYQRGAEWLFRVNGSKGRFLPGYLPALAVPMQDDRYPRQIGAALALARAARFLSQDRYAARATQAILTLLEDTVVDAREATCRHPSLPSAILNRLGAAGLLVLAINELPAPQADVLDKSEQMCNWIRRQARADGSLRCRDDGEDGGDDADSVAEYPGLALYAMLRSHKHRPAVWKLELARKALGYYRSWWRQHPKNPAFMPWQTAACAEFFAQSKEAAFAGFVYEMNDWVCGLQYDHLEPAHPAWYGGFMTCSDGKPVEAAPTIASAHQARGLAEALRVTRAGSDASRDQRYTEVLYRALQFVVRLQYTEANTQHFEDWYRPRLVGGFHASPRVGDLRLDYNQHALSALVTFLDEVSRLADPRPN